MEPLVIPAPWAQQDIGNGAGDPQFAGSARETGGTFAAEMLVVDQVAATVALSNLSHAYDGNPHSAAATTTPLGLPVDLTYNGSATAPAAPGDYIVIGAINDVNYQGSASATLTIDQPYATVTLANLTPTYNGNPQLISATTNPFGLAVSISGERPE